MKHQKLLNYDPKDETTRDSFYVSKQAELSESPIHLA